MKIQVVLSGFALAVMTAWPAQSATFSFDYPSAPPAWGFVIEGQALSFPKHVTREVEGYFVPTYILETTGIASPFFGLDLLNGRLLLNGEERLEQMRVISCAQNASYHYGTQLAKWCGDPNLELPQDHGIGLAENQLATGFYGNLLNLAGGSAFTGGLVSEENPVSIEIGEIRGQGGLIQHLILAFLQEGETEPFLRMTVGSGRDGGGWSSLSEIDHALNPVPLPPAALLFLTAIAGLVVIAGKKQKVA